MRLEQLARQTEQLDSAELSNICPAASQRIYVAIVEQVAQAALGTDMSESSRSVVFGA